MQKVNSVVLNLMVLHQGRFSVLNAAILLSFIQTFVYNYINQ